MSTFCSHFSMLSFSIFFHGRTSEMKVVRTYHSSEEASETDLCINSSPGKTRMY